MRKNSFSGKGVKNVFVVYEVKGLNLDALINVAKKRGVDLYDVKKTSNKRLIVSVSFAKSEIFFAIAKELCYNIKKVREKGRGYPLLAISRSFGLIIGAVLFCLLIFFANDFVFAFDFCGSGSVYKKQVKQYLSDNGVKEMARFSSIDLSKLEDGILADNKNLSFVSLVKRGNTLVIELVVAEDEVQKLNGNVYQMTADEDGVIEEIKVYRGTALVSIGDKVNAGDVLVDGYAVIKEQTIKINVLATAILKVQKTFRFVLPIENGDDQALALVEGMLSDVEITGATITKRPYEKEYEYEVTVYYRRIIYAG